MVFAGEQARNRSISTHWDGAEGPGAAKGTAAGRLLSEVVALACRERGGELESELLLSSCLRQARRVALCGMRLTSVRACSDRGLRFLLAV